MKFPWFILFCSLFILAHTVSKEKVLDKELKEISGWVFINDSTLIAHNDGDNKSELYVVNLKGKIIHTCNLDDTKNIDFEDITYDGKSTLYLGDIGNNNNDRKELFIYKMKAVDVLDNEKLKPEKIKFSYPEQSEFPAKKKDRHFDAESLAFHKDSLYVFTKCRTEPFDGLSYVYQLATKTGTQKAKLRYKIKVGKRDWLRDSATGAEIVKNKLYLLTYNRVVLCEFKTNNASYLEHINLLPITQKEAIAVRKNGNLYIADEKQKVVGGGNMYLVKIVPKKK